MGDNIAVIGGGIVGTATAEWLRRKGFGVTLIDRLPAGDSGATSYGNAGILAASSVIPVTTPGLLRKLPFYLLSKDSPLFLRWRGLPFMLGWLASYLRRANVRDVEHCARHLSFLLHDTVEQHWELSKETAAKRFLRRSDFYYLFNKESDFNAEQFIWKLRDEMGFGTDFLSGTALHDLDPNLSDFYGFALKLSNHGFISDPGAYVKALQEHFVAHGGEVLQGDVEDIVVRDKGVDIIADSFTEHFDKCVLAAGVHSGKLTRKLGLHAAIIAESGYHIFLHNPSIVPPAPLVLSHGKCVLTPMDKGLRLAGLVELGGQRSGYCQQAVAFLQKCLRQAYPQIEYDELSLWRGHRPATPDSLPLIGQHPQHDNIFLACGHQHIGLTAAAKSGRIIASLVAKETLNYDISAFRCDRFT